ncbi:hypothetical protein [Streptomyces chartreusis]|uniref:hypothetical protein n=1 Tax=Streptomyces chartreusis TaxID=1969 RepID=UPI0038186BF0
MIMSHEPASDEWRRDVLGGKPLTIRIEADGQITINGHPLTREMCAALQAERPYEAADFDYDIFINISRGKVPGLSWRRL